MTKGMDAYGVQEAKCKSMTYNNTEKGEIVKTGDLVTISNNAENDQV